jgi:hypothetical protein
LIELSIDLRLPALPVEDVKEIPQNSIDEEPIREVDLMKFVRRTTTESNFIVEIVANYELENFDDSDDISRSAMLSLVG